MNFKAQIYARAKCFKYCSLIFSFLVKINFVTSDFLAKNLFSVDYKELFDDKNSYKNEQYELLMKMILLIKN